MKYLTTILLLAFIMTCGVQQKLGVSYRLSPGMTKSEVEIIMGLPVKSDFKQNVEEWHYCRTGTSSDEFLALFFHEGKLVEKLNYTVTLADTRGATGSCQKFIKMGNYREPDRIIELRMR
jgi:hypothetical protein